MEKGLLRKVEVGLPTAVVDPQSLPPVLNGGSTPAVEKRVRKFYLSVADMFEVWVARHNSKHTQRAYRQAVMDFVHFLQIRWPEEGTFLFTVKVSDVQTYRNLLDERGYAPSTRNHRISAVSGFYRYMREAAIEMRLPINVPNPAHSQFIAREPADPLYETQALTLAKARLLRTLPQGAGVLDYRDRAIIDFYLYTGARIATGCRLDVKDFRWDDADPKVRINEKGSKRRTIGINL